MNKIEDRNKPHKCIAQYCFSTNSAILSPKHTTSEKGGFRRAPGNAQVSVEASMASWRHHTSTAP